MRVSELMRTPPVVCQPSAPLHAVARLMAVRDVGSVVVVDNVGYVCGIVTDRDIAVRGVGEGHSADVAVETVMTRDVAVVRPSSDLAEAAAVMQKQGVRRVPVVDDMGKLHGVIAMDDLFRQVSHETDTLTDALLSQTDHLRHAG